MSVRTCGGCTRINYACGLYAFQNGRTSLFWVWKPTTNVIARCVRVRISEIQKTITRRPDKTATADARAGSCVFETVGTYRQNKHERVKSIMITFSRPRNIIRFVHRVCGHCHDAKLRTTVVRPRETAFEMTLVKFCQRELNTRVEARNNRRRAYDGNSRNSETRKKSTGESPIGGRENNAALVWKQQRDLRRNGCFVVSASPADRSENTHLIIN